MPHIGIDAIGSNAQHIPHSTETVGVYVTGFTPVPWSAASIAQFTESGIERFNQDNDTNPHVGDVFDLESHAGTIDGGGKWAGGKKRLGAIPKIYVSEAMLGEVERHLEALGITVFQIHLANWSLNRDEAQARLGPRIRAVQFASPSSNPNMVLPGSHLTLAQAGCDVSICADDWFPSPRPKPRPHGIANAHVSVDLNNGDWSAKGAPGNWRAGDTNEWWEAKVGVNRRSGHWRITPLPGEKG